ncbi:MAG: ferric reductase-like transmembrane domain-containing protein [Ilumatobacter sp.]|uniref:ferric reductase-like transmembrane domain-containing protein n=1 Tax=Ilumatobacter sp. TaxID=1967498 RepID=UPI002635F7EF|nr:ferric reductase-like transmembrane domain-containing protein [Ilumatobacter sp.]MDJ0767151.1 ferric reductase-like transmembrane domain-containing protein [Ilumatobacter sp.]
MTARLADPPAPPVTDPLTDPVADLVAGPVASEPPERWWRRPLWNRFSAPQLVVLVLATIAPLVIVGAVGAALLGLISVGAMVAVALAAGENPGMITFGAMFLASPVQWWTGRSQVRVRKYLGIVFFLLALSNGVMFAIESGVGAALSAPFLVAGTVALALAAPLFVTSNRWSQRRLGMRRWRLLHKATYVVAVALMAHVLLIGDIGLGFVLISLGFAARVPAVKRWIQRRADRRRGIADPRPDTPALQLER